MKLSATPIPFLGLITNVDEASMPLGGVLACSNLARYTPDRVQRIPGIQDVINIANSAGGFPTAWDVRIAGVENLMAAIVQNSTTARIWNVTSAAEVTGATALTDDQSGLWGNIWSSVYYQGAQYVTNGLQAIQKILTATTRADAVLTGTATPLKGHFLITYLDRLFVGGLTTVAGVAATETDKTRILFSDGLSFNFTATNQIFVDEIPGEIMGLAINSPSSAGETIRGELIFIKESGLAKLTGDPLATTSHKDVISREIGSNSPFTFVNTPLGLIFMGKTKGKYSIFHLPIGSEGEPIDIGQQLLDILNNTTNPILNPRLSRAVYHDRFYKLFINRNGTINELWLDLKDPERLIWVGPHFRKCMQSPVVMLDNSLNLFEVIAATGKHLKERTSFSANFTAADQTTLVAEFNIPLNVEPINDDKSYDLLSLYIAKEANIAGSQISVERFLEGISQNPAENINISDSSTSSGFYLMIPLINNFSASLSGRSARVRVLQVAGNRFDVLKADVQYYSNESIRSRK